MLARMEGGAVAPRTISPHSSRASVRERSRPSSSMACSAATRTRQCSESRGSGVAGFDGCATWGDNASSPCGEVAGGLTDRLAGNASGQEAVRKTPAGACSCTYMRMIALPLQDKGVNGSAVHHGMCSCIPCVTDQPAWQSEPP